MYWPVIIFVVLLIGGYLYFSKGEKIRMTVDNIDNKITDLIDDIVQ